MRLKPQPVTPSYYSEIESQLKTIFELTIYNPIMDLVKEEMKDAGIKNSIKNYFLLSAINDGRIHYDEITGYFTGEFSSSISKELKQMGAAFDKSRAAFFLPQSKVPIQIIYASKANKNRAGEIERKINRELDAINEKAKKDFYSIESSGFLDKFMRDFKLSIAALLTSSVWSGIKKSDIIKAAEMSQEEKEDIKHEYSLRMDKWIKDWTEHEIKTLRRKVEENLREGLRADSLIKEIKRMKGVSDRKAKFLAHQETSIYVSEMRQSRMSDIGIVKYQWSTSRDERVRDDHMRLHGMIFEYSNPPITNRTTGARNNPGEDYGCRCVDIPII